MPEALHDRQTEAEATASLPPRIVELMVFLKDRLQLRGRDADAGVPYLDTQCARMPAAAKQQFAPLGVFRRVRQQVADHLFEQLPVAADRQAAWQDAQGEPTG